MGVRLSTGSGCLDGGATYDGVAVLVVSSTSRLTRGSRVAWSRSNSPLYLSSEIGGSCEDVAVADSDEVVLQRGTRFER